MCLCVSVSGNPHPLKTRFFIIMKKKKKKVVGTKCHQSIEGQIWFSGKTEEEEEEKKKKSLCL